jgi:ubiquinone/menaquinone biosynthesis C-methylase UbiE
MAYLRDPEGHEVKNLLLASPLDGKHVLEIGCGEGWLTWQYGGTAKRITGIDPCFPDLQKAKTNQPPTLSYISFAQCTALKLPFTTDKFDITLFANSL